MAIGLHPKYESAYPLGSLTVPQFIALAPEALAALGWQLRYISGTGLLAIATSEGRLSQITIRLEGDSARLSSISLMQELFDHGRNHKNLTALITMMQHLQARLPGEELDARYESFAHMLPHPEADLLLRPQPRSTSVLADIRAVFRPAGDYFITPLILNLNLAVFLLMLLSGVGLMHPDSTDIVRWGANVGELTSGGEWWRLLTACFVHIGAVHLLMNMYAFLLIGAQLEPRLGRALFLKIYLLSGIAASAVSLWWHDGPLISAGASGAIFGMYGAFMVLLLTKLVEQGRRRQLTASMVLFVGYSLLSGLQPGIDNAAHIGGLLSGAMLSLLAVPGLRLAQKRQRAAQAPPAAEVVVAEASGQDYY